LDVSDQSFNLAILARTEENALTLRSDFMVSACRVCFFLMCVINKIIAIVILLDQ